MSNRTCSNSVSTGNGFEFRRCEGSTADRFTSNNVSISNLGVGIGSTLYSWSDLGISTSSGEELRSLLDSIFGSLYTSFGFSSLDMDVDFWDLSVTATGSAYAWRSANSQGVYNYQEIEYQQTVSTDWRNLLGTAVEVAVALAVILLLRNLAIGRIAGSAARQGVENGISRLRDVA